MTVGDLVERLAGWIERLMPAGERRDRLAVEVRERFGGSPDAVTAGVCREIEQVAWEHSRHLLLVFEPDGTEPADEESKGWPPTDPDEVRARAAGVGEARRLDGGACLIRVDGLDAIGPARPFLEAAFTLADGAERILLDLRGNGGGDPATVALIAGRLLGDEAEQLSDVVYRDRRRQWWTPDLAPGTALTQPVAVLVGEGTFSSGKRSPTTCRRAGGSPSSVNGLRARPTTSRRSGSGRRCSGCCRRRTWWTHAPGPTGKAAVSSRTSPVRPAKPWPPRSNSGSAADPRDRAGDAGSGGAGRRAGAGLPPAVRDRDAAEGLSKVIHRSGGRASPLRNCHRSDGGVMGGRWQPRPCCGCAASSCRWSRSSRPRAASRSGSPVTILARDRPSPPYRPGL
ncbi:S41 family peptidase [Actinoplanes sp. NBRC 103695]|uniref:S41 family peptidase n=1 Tax=Actinoplanes sp. NBRC 103695 TaxID=3032202 RepID=UPI0024A198E8|nr:S41 family peptidase [Actinoplanes sp. NBRC 103695]GLY92821.1 hypothetical protein Acsp02_00770 [Actinoplanes sp. NBRC 103695]